MSHRRKGAFGPASIFCVFFCGPSCQTEADPPFFCFLFLFPFFKKQGMDNERNMCSVGEMLA